MEKRPPEVSADDRPILEQIEGNGQTQLNARDSDKSRSDSTLNTSGNGNSRATEDEPQEARLTDGSEQLYGAPADASQDVTTDDQPPHARQGKDDSNEEEKAAPHVRSILRKHLSTRVGAKPWTLPVPGPKIDPHGFEDPVCDDFFKDVWIASAVHNVSHYFSLAAVSPLVN